MNVLDLFSGIGGFSLGLERAGMRTVAFCEKDEYCRAVLKKHWPGVPCFDDIHSIDADGLGGLGRIDLVCGGFPCQPFSVAGEQKAHEDDRYLWPQLCRVIALARPAWVVGENVTGIISLALDDVLYDLEGLGYAARPFVIPACAVGADHRRDRVWIIAADTAGNGRQQGRESPGENVRQSGSVRDASDGGNANGPGLAIGQGKPGNDGSQLQAALRASWWDVEPDVGRVAHGVPRRVDRLRCLGNAVVPQIVEEIGRAIMRVSN